MRGPGKATQIMTYEISRKEKEKLMGGGLYRNQYTSYLHSSKKTVEGTMAAGTGGEVVRQAMEQLCIELL